MLLQTAVYLTLVGFAAWIVGNVMDYQGIAAVGGTIVVVVGASVLTGGLERKVGEIESTNADNETVVDFQYEPADLADQNKTGVLMMLLGAVMLLRSFKVTDEL